jgi:NAD-dependent dihydropyrimidine dehydrogenase PreA subunit
VTGKRVPREKIPWHPTVDAEKCTGCRVCFEFCRPGVYEWDDDDNRPKVARPLECLVGCNGCEPQCPAGAVSFPDAGAISELIRKLRADMKD